jgi:hypothetical protein
MKHGRWGHPADVRGVELRLPPAIGRLLDDPDVRAALRRRIEVRMSRLDEGCRRLQERRG